MKKIMKKCNILLIIAILFFTQNSTILAYQLPTETHRTLKFEAVPISAELGEEQYSVTRELAKKKASAITSIYGASSLQYAVIDNGEIIISDVSGVYSKSTRKPVEKNHMYGIGSVSKMFTASAVMKLVDEGKIDLDTPVINYIPEFKMVDERYKQITPRMLLNHSSGLLGTSSNNIMLFEDNSTQTHDNFLDILSTQRLKAEPGAFSVYCNDGFTLAEILIEEVSSKSFTNYIHDNFTNPMNMKNTKTPIDNFPKYNLAKIYMVNATELPVESFNAIGTGGIYSTAEDLCEFSKVFMKESNGILSQDSVSAMENKEYLNGIWGKDGDSTLGYGLGWDSVDLYPFNQYGIKALTKGGDTAFYHTSLLVLPELNISMAVLSSGSVGQYNQVMAQEVLLSLLKEKGIIDEIKPNKTFKKPVKTDIPSELKEFEGFYATFGSVIKISMTNDGVLKLANAMTTASTSLNYHYTQDKKFVSLDGSSTIEFVKEKNGNTYIYEEGYSTIVGLGQTALSMYTAQKLSENNISNDIDDIWQKRNNKYYYCINEKYSSQLYYVSILNAKIEFIKDMKGYMANATIIDENTARTLLEIPTALGRDLHDYDFYTKDGIEYFNANGMIYMSEDGVKNIPKKKFTATINETGDAKWYKVGKNSAKKKITVKSIKSSATIVYDKAGKCIYNSYINGKKTISLPKNGHIVFVGDIGSNFVVKYKK